MLTFIGPMEALTAPVAVRFCFRRTERGLVVCLSSVRTFQGVSIFSLSFFISLSLSLSLSLSTPSSETFVTGLTRWGKKKQTFDKKKDDLERHGDRYWVFFCSGSGRFFLKIFMKRSLWDLITFYWPLLWST